MRSWKAILAGLAATAALVIVIPAYADGPAVAGAAVAAPASAAPSTAGDERAQVQAVYQQMHKDIQQMREDAKTQIRALLTEQQQTQFDAMKGLDGGCPGPLGGQGCAGGQKMRRGPLGRGPGAPGLGGRPGAKDGAFEQHILNHLTQKLNLTDAEQASVKAVLDNTQTAMKARADQAHADFRAILTEDQAAKLDQLKAQGEPGQLGGRHGFHKGPGRDAAGGGPLQLTADQQAQKEQIFSQMRTDMQKLHADARTQIRALLTPDQQTQFDEMKPPQGPGAGGPRGEHMRKSAEHRGALGGEGNGAPLLDRLTTRLNLTDAQQQSVKSILDTLHTNVQARVQQARADAQTLRQEAGTAKSGSAPAVKP